VNGTSLSLVEDYTITISGFGTNTSYTALYSYEPGREALYIFANDNSHIYIFAVDLVGRNTAFIDRVASIGTNTPTGYGDPSLVWVDNSLNIVQKESGACPYMVYTTGDKIV